MSRSLRLPPKRNKITVERGRQVPMRDGTTLLADHYAPVGAGPRPAVLVRSPYGRGPQAAMMSRPYAERGYHVLLQSTRGTFGSGGQFMPAADEAADGQDTVAWMRQQPWFSGQFVLTGPSYLAFASWALAADPPPELTAMALHISPHDLAAAGFGHGPFELYNLLFWSDLMASQERLSAIRMIWRTMNAETRLAPAMNRLPIAATGSHLIGAGAPWYGDWLAHPSRGDSYWDGYSAAAALERVTVPTLLISGFHDYFVEQTMAQYQVLAGRGVPVALTIGPWNHMTLDMGLAIGQSLAWFDTYAGGNPAAPSPRHSPVRVWTFGRDQWRDLPQWPPAGTTDQQFYLRGDGQLAGALPDGGSEATGFRYDPADPTPSVGGRVMSLRSGGRRDNTALEARADVLTFSSEPLQAATEVEGVPVVRLHVSSDNSYHDLFVRLCDVDPDGRSHNLTDQIYRSLPEESPPGTIRQVEIRLTDVSHAFLPGHRIRLQVSGGAHPRFARNLGTDTDLLYGTRTAPVTHQVQHSELYPSALVLPVVGGSARPAVVTEAAQSAS